jgi:hypothetical protein
MSRIEQNGLEETKKLLKTQMQARYGDDSDLVTDDLIDQAVETVMDAASTMQEGLFNRGRIALNSELRKLPQTLLEANQKALDNYIAIKPDEGGRFSDAVVMKAASTMAEEFEMTDAAMDIILQVGSEIEDETGIDEVQSTLRTALNQAGMTPFSKFRQRQEELQKSKSGMLEPTSFSDYKKGKESELKDINDKQIGDLENILQRNIPAADKQVALTALSNNLNAVRRHFINQIAEEGQHAIGMIGKDQGYSWLKPNEKYDSQAITEMLKEFDSITSATKNAQARLQEQIRFERLQGIRPKARPTEPLAENIETSLRPKPRPAVVEQAPTRKAFLDPDYQIEITQDRKEEMDRIASTLWNEVKAKVSNMLLNSDGAELDEQLMTMLGFTTKEQLDEWKAKQ